MLGGPLQKVLRNGAIAALLGGFYAFGALIPFWYLANPAEGTALFAPAGLTLATLLLTPRRTWPLWLGAFAIAEISVDLVHNQSVFMALGFALANTAEPFVGATVVLWMHRGRRLDPRADFVRFVLGAVIIGPFVGATIGATVAATDSGADFAVTFGKWWLGDALGVLVIALPVLAWSRQKVYAGRGGIVETLALAALAAAVTVVPPTVWHVSLIYAVLPVLMLAALRGGPVSVGVCGFAAAISAEWVFATGRAAAFLGGVDKNLTVDDVQIFIGITLLVAMAFAVEVAERSRTERKLRESELTIATATSDERGRIAREIHDIVGHALNVMLLSAAGARRSLPENPDAAGELLRTVEDVGRDAFRDLDVALGLVDQGAGAEAGRGVDDLAELVDRLRRIGVEARLHVAGPRRPLPTLVDWSVYRIVQESLTNVTKHASGAHTDVNLRYGQRSLIVTVSNDAPQHRSARRNGHGLLGMRERVEVLGGTLSVGSQPRGGFAVTAEIPIERF